MSEQEIKRIIKNSIAENMKNQRLKINKDQLKRLNRDQFKDLKNSIVGAITGGIFSIIVALLGIYQLTSLRSKDAICKSISEYMLDDSQLIELEMDDKTKEKLKEKAKECLGLIEEKEEEEKEEEEKAKTQSLLHFLPWIKEE